jgi:hypothetical protein
MQHLHSRHKRTNAHAVVVRVANFFGLVEHGVEFSNFVTVADSFKQSPNGSSIAGSLEVALLDADLVEGRREKKVYGLGLVAVVSVVCHRANHFERDVQADGRAAERTVLVFGLAHVVSAVSLNGLG